MMLNELAEYAVKSSLEGRVYVHNYEDPREDFFRDKARVIHSKAFRRLDRKTQVLIAGSGDHYRTRLTHSIEVAQIAHDIATRLKLNPMLCEVIALAHDLGHTPFGHAGQEEMHKIMQEFGLSFEHNEQSKRIVEKLEKAYPGIEGLNLTKEVLSGLEKHKTAYDQEGKSFNKFAHLEAQVVNVADEIAYNNHDIDDGLRAGAIELTDLENLEIWQMAKRVVAKKYGEIEDQFIFVQRTISAVIGLMIDDLCAHSLNLIRKNKIHTLMDVKNFEGVLIDFSDDFKKVMKPLRELLFEKFYMHPAVAKMNQEGQIMIRKVFFYYYKNPDQYPGKEADPVKIKDYIAGMTDSFLRKEYEKL